MIASDELSNLITTAFDHPEEPGSKGINVFLLIELADLPVIKAEAGVEIAKLYADEFHHRARRLARTYDDFFAIAEGRVALVLRRIQNTQQIELAAAKLSRLFEDPIEVISDSLYVKPTSAFVVPIKRRTAAEEILELAERGILQAKHTDKAYVVISPGKLPEQNNNWHIQKEVEAAFERGEFTLYYQPKIHANFGSLLGAEALIRWLSEKNGLANPGAFIPYIENAPIIRPLTWFVIKSALSKCSQWPASISVSVNIPTMLLNDDEIVAVTRDALGLYEMDPARLTLEITESGFMEQPERSLTILKQLRDLGTMISIDDFGTGYSSLAYFRNLPATELKIDQTFVNNMCTDPRDEALVKTIIDLAHNFGLKVVAEGVEEKAQVEKLKEMGCDVLQGYLFGEPMPAAEFQKMVDKG
ncbi:MAG: EAL domain-containing protein [Proteobacteria bacterium]|nr:EAL domain-containing protein [Pseudomonadota bacterium]